MKKILSYLIIISIIVISFNNYSFASNNLDKKLYKETIISSYILKTQYSDWKRIISKIEKLFIKYRYEKDKKSATELQKVLKEKIYKLSIKKSLSRSERKMLAIYKNMYYRTVLLLDYWLK